MGKGDGKTKKPKKKKKNQRPSPSAPSTSTSQSSSSSSTTPPPQRVSNQINIPIRQQIAFAKQHRQAQHTTRFRQKAPKRTKYRRTEEDVQLAFAARGPQDPDWDVLTNSTGVAAPLVLVDGYNIIFQWARLKKHMVKGDTERARQLLVDDLESLRSLKGWRVECIFDGRRNLHPLARAQPLSNAEGDNTLVSRSLSKYGVRVVYTGAAVEADTYMESRCAQAKRVTEGKLTGSLVVATDDAMIRMAGTNAGAHCMSADRLVTELKAVRKGIAYKVERAVAQVNHQHSASGTTTTTTSAGVMRPEHLWGTNQMVSSPQNKCVVKNVAAERKKRKEERERDRIRAKQLLECDSSTDAGIPEWAQMPNRTSWDKKR